VSLCTDLLQVGSQALRGGDGSLGEGGKRGVEDCCLHLRGKVGQQHLAGGASVHRERPVELDDPPQLVPALYLLYAHPFHPTHHAQSDCLAQLLPQPAHVRKRLTPQVDVAAGCLGQREELRSKPVLAGVRVSLEKLPLAQVACDAGGCALVEHAGATDLGDPKLRSDSFETEEDIDSTMETAQL